MFKIMSSFKGGLYEVTLYDGNGMATYLNDHKFKAKEEAQVAIEKSKFYIMYAPKEIARPNNKIDIKQGTLVLIEIIN